MPVKFSLAPIRSLNESPSSIRIRATCDPTVPPPNNAIFNEVVSEAVVTVSKTPFLTFTRRSMTTAYDTTSLNIALPGAGTVGPHVARMLIEDGDAVGGRIAARRE